MFTFPHLTKNGFGNSVNYCLILTLICLSCNSDVKIEEQAVREMGKFELVSPDSSKVRFSNIITQTPALNILYYSYLFNGAGVALGDVNNDGLLDVFFGGNQVKDKLYVNRGDFKFEDSANIKGASKFLSDSWSCGVQMVDINNDGLLDIYVAKGGPSRDPEKRKNKLYINQGNLRFVESAEEYGVADSGHSTHSVFLDYDNDGDLDLFVLNHGIYFQFESSRNIVMAHEQSKELLDKDSNHLYRNNGNGKFEKVTEEAGLLAFGYGLGVCTGDFNQDGFVDIYVSNDFWTPDMYFVNQGDGTFSDEVKTKMKHVPYYGMGCDAGDINNDGLLDLFSVDMTAEDHVRSKTLMPPMSTEKFWSLVVGYGFPYQYMFNSLQLNNGNGTFSDIANMTGTARTDWSWAPLIADFDQDGHKDIFVSNGWKQNTLDNDFLNKYSARRQEMGNIKLLPGDETMKMIEQMKSEPTSNYFFGNQGNLSFEEITEKVGLAIPSFSNGAAYGDLDNDGDLDLVVNNIDAPAFIYQNQLNKGNAINIKIPVDRISEFLHAKISVYSGEELIFHEFSYSKGYASSCEPNIHIGLGGLKTIDRIEVMCLNGNFFELKDVSINSQLRIEDFQEATSKKESTIESPVFAKVDVGIDFIHKENYIDEFKEMVLLPNRLSEEGPALTVGDVNGDNLDDIFVGSGQDSESALYIQGADGNFKKSNENLWENEAIFEDVDALFFDCDNDNDLDLYVVSGGAGELANNRDLLRDRIYLNDGKGVFTKAKDILPVMETSSSCVRACDYDNDGDLDLFIGGRFKLNAYPESGTSYILRNNEGRFEDFTDKLASGLRDAGMITDAGWADINKDGKLDLVVCGEWMSVGIWINQGDKFLLQSEAFGTNEINGWWQSLELTDINNDGWVDILAGNIGENNKFHPSKKKPLYCYASDFDENGTTDIFLGKNYKGKLVPVRGKQCSSEQLPDINKRYETYAEFANADLVSILGESRIEDATVKKATDFSHYGFINQAGKKVKAIRLSKQSQKSPLRSMLAYDYNQDNQMDIFCVGNMHGVEIETARYDAGTGAILNLSNDQFEDKNHVSLGFTPDRDEREIALVKTASKALVCVASNRGGLTFYEVQKLQN